MGLVFVLSILPTGVFSLKHAEDLQAAAAYGQAMMLDARQHPVDAVVEVPLNHTVFHATRTMHAVTSDLTDVTVEIRWDTAEVPLRLGTRLYLGGSGPSP